MLDRYKVTMLKDTEEFGYKYRYLVLGFQSMKKDGKPLYTIVKQCRTEKRAFEYIEKTLVSKGQSRYIV